MKEIKDNAKKIFKENKNLVLGIISVYIILSLLVTLTQNKLACIAALISIILPFMRNSTKIANYKIAHKDNDAPKSVIDGVLIGFNNKYLGIMTRLTLLCAALKLAFAFIPICIIASGCIVAICNSIVLGISILGIGVLLEIIALFIANTLIFPSAFILAETEDLTLTNARIILGKSAVFVKKNFSKALLFNLSFIGWVILNTLTFNLAGLYAMPYYDFSAMQFYEKNSAMQFYEKNKI